MPFDFAPFQPDAQPSTTPQRKGELSILERLQILRELIPQSGDQGDFQTCAWSVARRDARLLAAGLRKYDRGHGHGPWGEYWKFFGGGDVPHENAVHIAELFSAADKTWKLKVIDKLIVAMGGEATADDTSDSVVVIDAPAERQVSVRAAYLRFLIGDWRPSFSRDAVASASADQEFDLVH